MYRSASTLGRIFILLTLFLVVAFAVIYVKELRDNLALDPRSAQCMYDSMMKQICDDPFGSSITWSVFGLVIYCGPLMLAWLVVGVALLIGRRHQSKRPVGHHNTL